MKVCCPNHAKTKHLQRVLSIRLKRPFRLWEAIGIVECLFQFAANSADDGRVGRYDNDVIACWFEWFPDENADHHDLIGALVEVGYLDEIDGNDRLEVHDWTDHAPKYIQDRLSKRKSRKLSKLVETCPEVSEEIAINPTKPNPTKPITYLKEINEIIEKWNSHVPNVRRINLRKEGGLTPTRHKKLLKCIDDDAQWIALANRALERFPLKSVKDIDWKPHIDWFLEPDSVIKVLEGQYDWGKNIKPAPPPKKPQSAIDKQKISLFKRIAAFRRKGEGDSDECERLRDELTALEKVS